MSVACFGNIIIRWMTRYENITGLAPQRFDRCTPTEWVALRPSSSTGSLARSLACFNQTKVGLVQSTKLLLRRINSHLGHFPRATFIPASKRVVNRLLLKPELFRRMEWRLLFQIPATEIFVRNKRYKKKYFS